MIDKYGRIGIAGRSQSGKSSFLDRMLRPHKRVVLFDTNDERAPVAKKEGFKRVSSIMELQERIDRKYAKGFKLWYLPEDEPDDIQALHNLSLALWNIQSEEGSARGSQNRPDIVFAVDEMADCFPNHHMKKDQDHFSLMCRRGRHKGIHLIGATQRFAEVSTKFRGQLNKRFLFNLTEPADLDVVRKLGGEHGKQLVQEVLNLPALHYIKMENNTFTDGKVTFD